MSHGSPTAYLLWAVLSTIFFIFLLVHLWLYDSFNCIKWYSGRQPGAFRRVMTYSYLATVPLLVVFSIVLTNIKFQEGYFVDPTYYIIPRPVQMWSPGHRRWIFPLNLSLSMAWAFEMVTHLEELAFWLFLLHQGPEKRAWFQSWEYKTWGLGSVIAVLGMPLTAATTRNDVERTQAWIFIVGSIAGTSTTISFLYILFRFPIFIQQVKQGGAAPDVVVRLATFYNLNRIRVVFRFLFTVPLLIIGLDAFFPPYRVILDPFALDFLLMISGIGCFVSSAITLFVFFPRSMTQEAGYTTKMPSPRHSVKAPTSTLPEYHHEHEFRDPAYPQEFDSSYEYSMSGPKHPSSPAYYPEPDYPPAVDGMGGFMRPSHEISYHEWTRGGSVEFSSEVEEMESSPQYEYDVDGLSTEGMQSESRSRPEHTERQESPCFGPPERHDSANTAVSQPISGDTTVETQAHERLADLNSPKSLQDAVAIPGCPGSQEDTSVILQSPSPARLRRYSDTQFSSRIFGDGIQQRRPNPEDAEKRSYRTREYSGPVIHPYLMNFTSPIDLLDTLPSDSHPSQKV